jgi:hypothetical protein
MCRWWDLDPVAEYGSENRDSKLPQLVGHLLQIEDLVVAL